MADLAAFTRFARTYHPGEIIFAEYEPGDSFYLIQMGKVQISIFGSGAHDRSGDRA